MTLLLPTDGCRECVTETKGSPVHPYQVVDLDPGVVAGYRCPSCDYVWWTSWAPEALGLPCPGCDLCVAEMGGAA